MPEEPKEEEKKNEHICVKCNVTKMEKPTDDDFGEIAMASIYDYTIDESGHYHQSSSKYRIVEKQRKFVCKDCVLKARKSEFILLGVFYGLLLIYLIVILFIKRYSDIKFTLAVAAGGMGIYFYLRQSGSDIRDKIVKVCTKLKDDDLHILTRKNIARQEV